MSKPILQNIPEAKQVLEMEIEELAGYVLEHLHGAGGNTLSHGNSLPLFAVLLHHRVKK